MILAKKNEVGALFLAIKLNVMIEQNIGLVPHYLPTVGCFRALYRAAEIYWVVDGTYEKQSYRNRAYVLMADGLYPLIIPIQHVGRKQLYKETKIDYSVSWVRRHLRTMATAYGQSPYYGALAEILVPIFQQQPTFLCDLNMALLNGCFHFLQMKKTIRLVEGDKLPALPATFDARGLWHPKKATPLSTPLPDYQKLFLCNHPEKLSILDLLAMQGPYAHGLLG